jgi:hypothetical protein
MADNTEFVADGHWESGGGDLHSPATWRSGIYVDKNGVRWSVYGTGQGMGRDEVWNVEPADDTAGVFYQGTHWRKGAIVAFAEGLDMAIKALDETVIAYDQAHAQVMQGKKDDGGGWLFLLILAALVATDKKGRR